MASSPVFLITAASGHIGEHLIPMLLEHPAKPTLVLPTSNADRLTSKLPKDHDSSQVHVIAGNVSDANFVQKICHEHSVTAVFLCLTTDAELFVTMNFLDALRRSPTVKHLVYLSACADFSLAAIESGALKTVNAGHVVVKFLIEAKLKYGLAAPADGGMSWTVLGPSLFFINDLRSKKSILEDGFFDEPVGSKGVSRVHPVDIARAAMNALVDGGEKYHGKKFMIGSLKTYTNVEVGKLWSEKLGREVRAAGSDEKNLDEFEAHFSAKVGPLWGRDMRLMYTIFEKQGFSMSENQYKEQVELLGKEAEDYDKWVEDVAKEWKKEM